MGKPTLSINFAIHFVFNPSIEKTDFKVMSILKKIAFLATFASLLGTNSYAAAPDGYYDACEGKTGEALLTALYQTITNHTTISYNDLWTLYKTSDIDANGKIWDMYSTKRWTPGSDQCGNYSSVGDCYNREHSFPKSWFNDASPMVSDAFHIYPTDGKVNGQRSNYPFGECANGTYLASNGGVKPLGRLGSSTFSGYSGTVFEPDNQYKGDFARSYFYMAACYNNRIANWDSDMLAGNSYPAFSTWAINLLMKWTRQDEVSQKELDRQEAVYAQQRNRNPFIDHPELAEYIWGDKKGTAWHSNSSPQPDILQPTHGETIDLGIAAVNVARTKNVFVKTRAIEGNVTFSIYDRNRALSIATTSISAAQANAGYNLAVTCNGSVAKTVMGTLTITADDMELEVDITCEIIDGLPIGDATNVSSNSFTINWVNVGVADTYSLDVKLGQQSITGYPKTVNASAETYTVTSLEPNTTYTYQLSASTISSVVKSVTTADLIPSIDILFDGQLAFETTIGTPSDIAELLLEIENISEEIQISVNTPFEISSDKSSWGTTITLDPEEDRFYMRVLSAAEGTFETYITVTAGQYTADDFLATATVSDPANVTFLETFNVSAEIANANKPYVTNGTFAGIAAKWNLQNAGIGSDTQDMAVNGSRLIRFGKTSTSSITMVEDKTGGLGTVTFEASKWNKDANTVFVVEYSLDGGNTWTSAEQFTLTTSDSNLTTCTVTINKAGNGRIRFRQTSGSRWFVDNVSITNYTGMQSINDLEYHQWDAFCRNGLLVVECRENSAPVSIYDVDGITWITNQQLTPGEHTFNLPKGLYIVVSDDFSRRVLVK